MRRAALRYSCHVLFFFAILMLPIPRVSAQYFGQNKVQYENFKFQILKTEHFDIYYYPEEKEAAEQAGRMAERWYARQKLLLQHELQGRQTMILYASHPHFQQTNTISGGIGEGTGGVTEALRRRIVLPFAGPIPETDHVIGHELVHAFQYDVTGVNTGGGFRSPVGLQLPLWFMEGMAELLSIGATDPHTAMWMRDAVKQKKLPSLRDLEGYRFFPYRFGQAFLAYLSGRYGDAVIGDLLKQAGKTGNVQAAIRTVLHAGADTLAKDWHQAMREAYEPLLQSTTGPEAYGKQVISKKTGAGEMNVGPVLSPDGKSVMFFSEKDLFSINLYLADARTGDIKRTLVRTEVDPHYESLGFITSAGAWDANGNRVAFAQISEGRPAISVLDVRRNRVIEEIPFRQLGEIFNPTWSPDGRYIAFSAMTGGMTDLFLFDLQNHDMHQVTEDFYSDLHPAWSPDGKNIVFATDRFSANLEMLQIGNSRLALYNVETGKISALPAFEQGKHINPQWAPDGKSVYFISDRNGISNVYRVELASGALAQVTNLYTGVSGISASSPALSVALKANRLSFSAFENGQYNIYMIDTPEVLAGQPLAALAANNPAVLPPAQRTSAVLAATLQDWNAGLPAALSQRSEPYRSKLGLTYIGQPVLAAGYDSYGAYLGGGISFYFSDMLGNHNLGIVTQAQFSGAFQDIAAQVGYGNSSRRWNWGAVLQQIPYVTSQFASGVADVDGRQVYVEQELRYRQLNQEISGFMAYPFSRAQRFEFSLGYRRIGFDQQLRTRGVSLATGEEVIDERQDLPAADDLNLMSGSVAFIYDTAIFGATSPIIGQSLRLESSPVTGTLQFNGLLFDYRRYFIPVRPFTLAARALHYGRYGRDGEDNRLAQLFLGYPGLVRGYDSNSFDSRECIATSDSTFDCPVFDQLYGSRMALANFELRFPLFGLLNLGPGYYGALPIETGLFYDLGVAWTRAQDASFLGGSREFVRSYGAAMRINLMGYVIMEFDYVKPVDRPRKGWFWQFNFIAGF